MRTLFVTDLDGTLLNRGSRISDFSRKTINGLVEKGLLFTYATARSLASASVVAEGLSTEIPIIAYNGAFIVEPSDGKILLSNFITEEQKGFLKDVFRKNHVSPLVYAYVNGVEKVTWRTALENDGIQRYLSLRKGDKRFQPLSEEEADKLYVGDSFYYTCIGEKEELQPVYEALKDSEDFNVLFHQELYRPEYWCEILPKKATKANAIAELKKLWGCEKVVSFGDAVNDIPMFEISDECYAVENAVEELKKLATGVIGSNEDDGVAKWLLDNWKKWQ
ncbi:MAG: HAD family hydrolase [Lachnospiraceae bacterium]|nr:HAD family hydrolase [Lachnospiraceae bacterium]